MKEKIKALLEHPKLNEYIANPMIFVAIYAVFMAITYIMPYYEFSAAAGHALNDMATALNQASNEMAVALNQSNIAQNQIAHIPTSSSIFPFTLHVIALLVLVLITYVKAQQIEKTWITILPLLALGFDILPLIKLIPLVPTGLHVATIIIAVKGKDQVVYVDATNKDESKGE